MNRNEERLAMLIQASDVDIQQVSDGYVVYQKTSDSVHCLNRTAAILFELCDGTHEADHIVAIVVETFGLGPSAHDEIRAGLGSLVRAGLVLPVAGR